MSSALPPAPLPRTASRPTVIAVVLPDSAYFTHPEFQPVFAAAAASTMHHGCEILLSAPDHNPEQFNGFLASIDGLVFAPYAPNEHACAAQQAQVPHAVAHTPEMMEQAIGSLIATFSDRTTK